MLSKKYLKRRTLCKVTFSLPKSIHAETAALIGDFNNWNPRAHPMKRVKNGTYQISLDLEGGREYQFRYLVNGQEWHNDDQADRYIPNEFGSENSVVVT